MRKIYMRLLLGLLFALGTVGAGAQVSTYSFTNSSPGYTPISGGTVLGSTGSDEEVFNNNVAGASAPVSGTGFPIGFNFTYNGVTYDKFAVAYNGYIVLGTGTFSIDNGLGSALSTSTVSGFANAIAVFNTDLVGQTGSELSYQLSGVAGSQVLTVQWKGVKRFSNTSNVNFQIKLNEGTNTINFIYGGVTTSTNPTSSPQVGLRGANNADEHPRTTTTNWAATTLGTNASTCTFSTTVAPASGIAYTFTPPVPCTTPASLAASISLTPGVTSIQGSFTAAPPTIPSGYLVVRTATNTQPVPVDGTTYVTGANAIGYIEYVNTAAGSWTSTALSATTPYYYWVFSYNNTVCTGGPKYSAAATTSTTTTTACSLAGTYDVGPGAVSGYLTLKSAVDDIVLKGITGSVILELNAAYSSSTDVVFPIALGTVPCAASGTTITIRPAAGAGAKTITSANTTATIDINGGNYWIIDGQQGGSSGTKDLTIANTSTSGTAVRFINEASNNTVKFSVLQGINSGAAGAVITFAGTTGASGNDNDIITSCDVRDGATTPTNGIYSLGQSAAISNDNITISNNNIFNYFQAGNATAGINVNTNNNGWTISGNSFYQTAARTSTASNQHSGIFISNSGTGFAITGNFIGGGAAGCGGAAWQLLGAFTNRFVGISVSAATTATTSIQGNTVANFSTNTNSASATTNGNFCGIAVAAGNAAIGTVTANTIGSTTGNGNITVNLQTNSGGSANIISYSGAGTADIRNNVIGSINLTGATTSIGESFNGILIGAGSPTIVGNTIGGSATNSINSSTVVTGTSAVQTVCGINISTGVTASSVTISGNIINNLTQAGTTSGANSGAKGIQFFGTGSAPVITGNTIKNLSGATANATVSLNAAVIGIVSAPQTTTAASNISGNTIFTLKATNNTAVQTNVFGILITNSTASTVQKNKIYDLQNASIMTTVTTPPTAVGICSRAAVTSNTISNNFVSLGNAQTTNTQFVGILQGSTTTGNINVYNNSVVLFGTASSGALPSFGFLRGDNSTTAVTTPVDIRNNIFDNKRSGGTGKHYAISNNYGVTTASTTGWGSGASDYNVLNSANTATIGLWTSDRDFTNWKLASASDANSKSSITVTYADAPNGDLHLNMGVTPTQIESGGVTITAVTDDIDLQGRPGPAGSVNGGGTAYDIGADEFDGAPLDITPPVITYTVLPNTGCANPPTFTAVITDPSSVNVTAGTKPRLWYRKGSNLNVLPATNDNTTDGWKYVEATNAATPFSFTFDFTLLSGGVPAAGDVINYFVTAQDMAAIPNVAINAGTFTAVPPTVALNAGAFPVTGNNTYTVSTPIATGVTVGTGGTYTTLSGAGGLFAAINAGGLSGNTTATILGNITETGAVALNQVAYGCSGNYTLTIVPGSGVTALLSGSSTTPLIDLNGADNVTFDGSNSGTTSKDLTIRNTGSGPVFRLINDATLNTVKNTIIESQNSSSTSGTIFFSTTTGLLGNSNNIINNCDVRDRSDATGVPANAVYSSGSATVLNAGNTVQNSNVFNWTNGGVLVTATGVGDNWTISANNFYQTAARSAALTGISVLGGNGHSVINNFIGGTAAGAGGANLATSSTITGISLAVGTVTATSVQGNVIKNIRSTSASFTSSYGITLTAGKANIGNITGNTIGSANVAERFEANGDDVGINVVSTSSVNVSNNIINNMTTTSTVPNGEYYFGIIVDGAGGTHTVVNNTVTNLTNGSFPDISGGFNTQTIGMLISATGVQTVSGNTISNVGSTNATASTSSTYLNRVWGMIVSGTSAGTVIEKNVINNIYGSSAGVGNFSDVVTCLQSQSVASATYRNNMISTTGGGTGSRNLNGILDISASPAVSNYYYNSVNISGIATSTVNNYAFNRNSTATVTILNNIFSNSRTGGTGFQVAIANTNAAATGWSAAASNYNDLYSATPANLCQWLGSASGNNRTLAAWQAAQTSGSGGDANSISILPSFVSAADLHLTAANCGIDGRGIPVAGITADIDGNTRDLGAPDMGADEFTATLSGSLAIPTGSGTTNVTYNVSPSGTTFTNANCETIATLLPSGGSAVAGSIKAAVTVDASVQTYGAEPYVQRHYDIEPATNASTSTATVTLYFTDAEFTNYNSSPSSVGYKNLPTAALGNADPNIANLRINQYHGTGTLPGNYTGAQEVIDPADANIVWNSTASRWEVTIPVTGFSGFYVTTVLSAPLPITINYFRGAKQGTANILDWKVNVVNSSTVTLSLERSADGRNFGSVYSTTATDVRTQQPFTYTDANPLAGVNYYRLKMTDANGKVTYSSIVTLLNAAKGFEMINIAPNPVVGGNFKLNITAAQQTKMTVTITDMAGRIISRKEVTLIAGFNGIDMNGNKLAAGTYQLYGNTADGRTKALSFVKQ